MPQVAPATVKARAGRLRAAAAKRKWAWLDALTGSRQRVLIERGGRGHAENFAEVVVEGTAEHAVGRIVEVTVTGRAGEQLLAAV